MKRPLAPGSPIDPKRIRIWLRDFSNFRETVTDAKVRDWIAQFQNDDLAARLLDSVDMVTHSQLAAAFRTALNGMSGWHTDEAKRKGKWRFAAYSSSAGESGDAMLAKFRHANNLAGKQFKDLFIHRSEILAQRLGPDDTMVLVDDFVGSGSQVCAYWNDAFSELVAEIGRVILVVYASCSDAAKKVRQETSLDLVSINLLTNRDNIFHSSCKHFTEAEKRALLTHCEAVDQSHPKGFGDLGLVLVFAHNTPNNSIPVLHKRNGTWEPLFPRYD